MAATLLGRDVLRQGYREALTRVGGVRRPRAREHPGRSALVFGLLAGTVFDAMVPDPRRGHPVALFGRAAGALERRMWADSRSRGAAYLLICAGLPVLLAGAIDRRSTRWRFPLVAMTTWTVLGARSLRAEARAVHAHLAEGDLDGARSQVTHLVGRDPNALDAGGVTRAALESVAENTCDALVAPLLWGAVAGLPGLVGYRAVNTLDAMVGHHSDRYERFGWASARADDLANLVPARITALLVGAVAPRSDAWRIARRDGRAHPSPNSGFSEAAYAGALGVTLGGRNVYAGRVEQRPRLGDGPAPGPRDLQRATRLLARVTVAASVTSAAVAGRPRVRR
jgi:adenosylcobinamide-phosphate synthase